MFQPQGLTDQFERLNNDWFVYLDYNHNAKTSGVQTYKLDCKTNLGFIVCFSVKLVCYYLIVSF